MPADFVEHDEVTRCGVSDNGQPQRASRTEHQPGGREGTTAGKQSDLVALPHLLFGQLASISTKRIALTGNSLKRFI
jgi:hypothetical protein